MKRCKNPTIKGTLGFGFISWAMITAMSLMIMALKNTVNFRDCCAIMADMFNCSLTPEVKCVGVSCFGQLTCPTTFANLTACSKDAYCVTDFDSTKLTEIIVIGAILAPFLGAAISSCCNSSDKNNQSTNESTQLIEHSAP